MGGNIMTMDWSNNLLRIIIIDKDTGFPIDATTNYLNETNPLPAPNSLTLSVFQGTHCLGA